MIAEPVRRPPDRPIPTPRRITPLMVAVGRIQGELGVRLARPIEAYGATSHLSEELLFAGYRRAGEVER